jgi:2-hydroxychromene-2-carboxylate isomerase
VDYIVRQTVGKLVAGQTPRQISKLRILDPACGSGSFLLGAYQYLLDYHRQWYENNDPAKHARRKQPAVYQAPSPTPPPSDGRGARGGGEWRLTGAEKKRILLNNIYGVDIDRQAVEVTKLSLLLKVLEGETEETLGQQLSLWRERALPDLGNNIKCGNSLIGPDYFEAQLMPDEEEMRRVNPFDWEAEFPEVMAAGGFDCVIGNPPWIFTKYVDWGEDTKSYIQKIYLSERLRNGKSRARQAGKINLFAIFVLKGISILKDSGLFGFIVPNNILRTTVYDTVRKRILESSKVRRIVDLKAGVFSGVTASTIILLVESGLPDKDHRIEVVDNKALGDVQEGISNYILQIECLDNPSYVLDIFTDPASRSLINRMNGISEKLGTIVRVLNGIATHKNKEGILDEWQDDSSKPILFGKDVARYHSSYSGKYVNYVRGKLLRARDEKIFLAPEKLIMQRIGGILVTAYDDQQYYTFNSINNLILRDGVAYSIKHILGVINSKLMRFYYITRFTNKSSLTVNISKTFLDQLPIRTINFDDPADVARHDKMVGLVERMLALHQKLAAAAIPADKQLYQRQIEATDRQIDALVYELYGLTEEEIEIVAGEGG